MPPTSGPTSLKTCGTLASGSYVLAGDLPPQSSDCLTISGSGVSLDCKSHTINGTVIVSSSLSNVSIANCKMRSLNVIQSASGLSLTNSTITSTIAFLDSSNLKLDGNTISTSLAWGDSSAVIYVAGGQNNAITNNTLDGGYHGNDQTGQGSDASPTDTDDGIVIIDATGDTISGNTISNVFDAGIEGVNGVRNSTITNNTISNALFAGISSYHCTAWEGNTISGNAVTQSEAVMMFLWEKDARCDTARNPPASPSFSNNTMSNNTFTNPVGQYYAVYISFDKGASVSDNRFSNNRIQGSVLLSPLAGFTVGSGNACSSGGDVHC